MFLFRNSLLPEKFENTFTTNSQIHDGYNTRQAHSFRLPWCRIYLTEPVPEAFEINTLCARLSSRATNNSAEIVYISYKNLRYTFGKCPPWKLIDEYCFLAPMFQLAISSAALNIFSETLHENNPVVRAK